MRWIMMQTALIFTFVIGFSTLVHSSDSSNITEKGEWQYVTDQLRTTLERVKYFFSNDIPHFFKKDVPEELSAIEHSRKKFAVEVKEEYVKVKELDACECARYSCGCCQHLDEPSIHLNSTLCANITYLSEDIGLSLTVTVNNYAIFNETVSVRNPPPICLGVPYVKEYADACLRLYDIDATRSHFHACAQVEARMKHILIAKYELGCFDIGPFHSNSTLSEENNIPFQEPSVMLV